MLKQAAVVVPIAEGDSQSGNKRADLLLVEGEVRRLEVDQVLQMS